MYLGCQSYVGRVEKQALPNLVVIISSNKLKKFLEKSLNLVFEKLLEPCW